MGIVTDFLSAFSSWSCWGISHSQLAQKWCFGFYFGCIFIWCISSPRKQLVGQDLTLLNCIQIIYSGCFFPIISSLPKGIHTGLSYLQGKCFLSSGFQRFLFKLLWFVRVHFLFIEKKEPRQIWELQWRKYHLKIGTSFQSSPCNAQNFQYSLELRFNLSSGNTLLLYPLFFSCSANQSCLSYSVYSSLPPRAQYTGAYVDTPISILFNITRLSIHHYA